MKATDLLNLAMDVIAQTSQAFKLFIEESIAQIPSKLSPAKQVAITIKLKQIKSDYDYQVASLIESLSNLQESVAQREIEQITSNNPPDYACTNEQLEKTVNAFINNYKASMDIKIGRIVALVVNEHVFESCSQSLKNLAEVINRQVDNYLKQKEKIKS